MLSNEIQVRTNLSRKALEYYEEKGLIQPIRLKNGYRDYSEDDLKSLQKINVLRKLGLSTDEIMELKNSTPTLLSSLLRKKQFMLEINNQQNKLISRLVEGEDINVIEQELNRLERERTIYDQLTILFPGYIGQMFFFSYKAFFQEPICKDGEEAFEQYIKYLDSLPSFELTEEEKEEIEKLTSDFNIELLISLNQEKMEAINSPAVWLENNKEAINAYKAFIESDNYHNSTIKRVRDKLRSFLSNHQYYETAIPLIRRFSRSYDKYYEKLLEANQLYLDQSTKENE